MVKNLSKKWALWASKDSRPLFWSCISLIHGLVFLSLYLSDLVPSVIMVIVSVIFLETAFLLFERAGFIQLIESE